MSSLLNQRRLSSCVVALASVALGILLIIFKDTAVRILVMCAGLALLILGAVYIIGYFTKKEKVAALQAELLLGLVLFLLGLWMAASPGSLIGLLQYVIGALIVIHGVIDLQAAFNMKRADYDKWWVSLVLAGITMLLGLLIIINPFGTLAALLTLIGVILVYDGLSDLYIIFRVSRVFKDAVQEAAAVETEGEVIDDEKTK